KAPIGIEAVARIDALFAIEREINGAVPAERQRVRQERSKPLVDELGRWLREQYGRVSPGSKIGKAIAYSLNHWDALVRFLDDGRLCMSTDDAEKADSSLSHRFWRRCLPSGYHALIGSLGTLNIESLAFPDLPDPIISAG